MELMKNKEEAKMIGDIGYIRHKSDGLVPPLSFPPAHFRKPMACCTRTNKLGIQCNKSSGFRAALESMDHGKIFDLCLHCALGNNKSANPVRKLVI
jgi:hypothetical protein